MESVKISPKKCKIAMALAGYHRMTNQAKKAGKDKFYTFG